MLKDHDLHGRRNWITDFKNMLRKFGCEQIWEKENSTKEQHEQYINSFKEGMIEFYESEWKHKLRNSSKLLIHASFKFDMRKEDYIKILTLRKFLGISARFRTSNHTLEIELGRHEGLLLSQRICAYCDFHGYTHIEDEFHFILVCPMYNEFRQKYLSMSITPGSHEYNLFVEIMSKTDSYHVKNLAALLREGFNERKRFLRNIN